MRIIKEGKIPEKIEHEVTCNDCRTVFAFTLEDTKPALVNNERAITIVCPLCKTVYKVIENYSPREGTITYISKI